MDSKYCSACIKKLPLSVFLKDASNPASKVLATCDTCWARTAKSRTDKSKRKALQPLDLNIQSKRRVPPTRPNPSLPSLNPVESRLEPSIVPLVPAETRLEATIPPNPPESRLGATIPPPNPPKS